MSDAVKSTRHPFLQNGLDAFASRGKIRIEVPEWGTPDEPAIIIATPMTIGEQSKIFPKVKKNDVSMLVDVLIMKAKDEDGNPIFRQGDQQHMLRGLDPDVVARVANEIMGVDPDDAGGAEAEKN